ncbi:MAG: S8 family serine peptidase, partial [Dongiaceae bacterium]
VGGGAAATAVTLRRIDLDQLHAMNDKGKNGDLVAGDNRYGIRIAVDTGAVAAGTCIPFEAIAETDGVQAASPVIRVCVSSFPVRIAPSDTTNPVTFKDGTRAVADELLLRVAEGVSDDEIRALAADVGAIVVGGVQAFRLYQLKLPSAVSAKEMLGMLDQLQKLPGVQRASLNALGTLVSTPNDTEFPSQHGLTRIRAHDAWEAGATGSGITVVVLDTGIDSAHDDFGTSPGNCQLIDNDCGAAGTDVVGHGTQVAGVIAARTHNALGVAGAAPESKIKSIKIPSPQNPTDQTEAFDLAAAYVMQALNDAAAYGLAQVVNASWSGGPWAANVDVPALCSAIESLVVNGVTPEAIVVVAAGNNNSDGYYYPGRCNDSSQPHAGLTRKDLLIVVSNSLSSTASIDPSCAPLPDTKLDDRCGTSNYGAWVDVAAPGTYIRTTDLGGGYTSVTGTSFAAPFVSAASAALLSCNVPLDQIESALTTGTTASMPYPGGSTLPGGSTPRIDVYAALVSRNTAPSGLSLAGVLLNENTDTSAGFEAGTLSVTDPDVCDIHTYSIVAGVDDAASFAIGGSTNNRLILTAGVLDYEAKPSYSVTVRVTDIGGQTDHALVVGVTNLDEAPPAFTSGATATAIDENSGPWQLVYTATAVDPATDGGPSNPVTYAIGGTDEAAFGFNTTTGETKLIANPNYELKASYSFTVTATDAANNSSAPLTVTLAINDVVEPIPNPVLVYSHVETGTDAFGNTVDRHRFLISNWYEYPAAMFISRPDLPPCGLNPSASRTWVDFFRTSDNGRIYGFCDLETPANLNLIWFGVIPAGAAPPASVYVKFIDRQTGIVYTSNSVAVPIP